MTNHPALTFPCVSLRQDGGAGKDVDIHTLPEYLDAIVKATVVDGVRQQMNRFLAGFDDVFDHESLRLFSVPELGRLLSGLNGQPWPIDTLAAAVKPDHGYRADSHAIALLFEVMSEFSAEEQRLFVSFVTGSPNLPVGGVSAIPRHLCTRVLASLSANAWSLSSVSMLASCVRSFGSCAVHNLTPLTRFGPATRCRIQESAARHDRCP